MKHVQDEPARIVWPRLVSLILTSLTAAAPNIGIAAPANSVDAVTLEAPGILKKRIDWLVASSKRTYHHIKLPSRVAVGDTITFSFGSSMKIYRFSVARITLKGDHCKIFSQAKIHDRRDRIDVTPCYAADAPPPAPNGRP